MLYIELRQKLFDWEHSGRGEITVLEAPRGGNKTIEAMMEALKAQDQIEGIVNHHQLEGEVEVNIDDIDDNEAQNESQSESEFGDDGVYFEIW